MSTREIENKPYTISEVAIISDPLAEMKKEAAGGKYEFLLAHAHDGVIWGVFNSGAFTLSSDEGAFPEISPLLRNNTLCELRLFGKEAEWFVWRTENGWNARTITDNAGESGDTFVEKFILWGTESDAEPKAGFHPVRESDLGIQHTPPVPFKNRHQTKIVVRHYLDYDPAGAAYIKLSRLVDLENGGAA